MSTLRSIHDVLARNLNRTFTSALRHKAEVYFHKIDQLSTSDFISGLESPSVIYMLSVKELGGELIDHARALQDRKSTRLNSSHVASSYAVFCLKKKKTASYCHYSYMK